MHEVPTTNEESTGSVEHVLTVEIRGAGQKLWEATNDNDNQEDEDNGSD